MEQTSSTQDQNSLESLRRRRAELRESMSALESALAAPAAKRQDRWPEHVRGALGDISADFAVHVEITEGPDGLYQEVLGDAPRLSNAVAHLTKEHGQIMALLDELRASVGSAEPDVEKVREQGTELLGRLVRHRQRGSDLVYEAYEFDIGGDT